MRLIKERITVGVTDADKATVKSEHKAFGEILLDRWW